MSEYICLLITIYYESEGTLLKCAFRCKRDALDGDWTEYPMEHGTRGKLWGLLPDHVRYCGSICAVEEIFEIHTANAEAHGRRSRTVQPLVGDSE
jgi:hypothetical protein